MRARAASGGAALVLVAAAVACRPGGDLTGGETSQITGAEPLDTSTGEGSTSSGGEGTSTSTSTGGELGSSTTSGEDPGYCGDKVVQEGEECDEGSGNSSHGGCLPGCVRNVCGDGLLWTGVEECDLAEDNSDDWKCTSECRLNVCGDGHRIKYIEECDDGLANSDDAACTSMCTINVCGDGFWFKGQEECDDGDALNGDGCSLECEREQVSFVTSATFTGDLGGVAGADAKCQEAAKYGGILPWAGADFTYKAWIADPECPPRFRFPPADRPYRRVDGYQLASSFADFIDGDLDQRNLCAEDHACYFNDEDFPVWTAALPDGMNGPALASTTCNFWTLDGDFFFGSVGNARYRDSRWTEWTVDGAWVGRGCNQPARLYCIQIDCNAYPEYCEPDFCGD